jgi:hypothetical protein
VCPVGVDGWGVGGGAGKRRVVAAVREWVRCLWSWQGGGRVRTRMLLNERGGAGCVWVAGARRAVCACAAAVTVTPGPFTLVFGPLQPVKNIYF